MLLFWVWYAQLKKISCHQKLQLLRHFRDPEEIYHSSDDAFENLEDVTESVRNALADKSLEEAKRILAECGQKSIGILPLCDEAYPSRLRNTYDPPMVLYFKGELQDWENLPLIGIVGTRKASTYGMSTANRFGRQIASCGALVISGGAAGIDTMAMQGAMETGNPVIGVLGSGVDIVYPAANRDLFRQIQQRGCLISEYPPGTKADGWRFPLRNRIISGMSNGLLVVEAPEKSGALITANHAREQGREVFVVPGNVGVAACAGSNALLQAYAIAALSGWDVVKEYEHLYPGKVRKLPDFSPVQKIAQTPRVPTLERTEHPVFDKKAIDKDEKSPYIVVDNSEIPLKPEEQAVFALIDRQPKTLDDVIEQAELPPGTVKSILTRLAIRGLVVTHPGGRVSRK